METKEGVAILNDRLDRIESKLDSIKDHTGKIDVTLARQASSLEEHMRRTAILEAAIIPIQKHDNMWQGAMKVLVVVGAIASLLKILAII